MIIYVSKIKDILNRKEVRTEFFSNYICLNPKYPNITIKNKNVKILMDSGAFQDTEAHKRISPEEALSRQLELEKRVGVPIERIVAYDFIGDVGYTIKNNKYLASKRGELKPRQLVLMVQGTTTQQYLACLREILEMAEPSDCIGFGGVALAGKRKSIKEKLVETLRIGIPLIQEHGIRDIHVFGLGTLDVLREIGGLFNGSRDCFNISCDSATIEVGSIMGRVLNEETERWERTYTRKDKYVNYHPCDLMHSNIGKAIRIIGRI